MSGLHTEEPQSGLVAEVLRPVPEYCDVLGAHIHDVIEQTGEAAAAIVRKLTAIDSMAEVMSGDVARLAGTLTHVETELTGVTSANDQRVDRLIRYFLHRDEQIHRLVEEMRGVRQQVRQIEEVSRATDSLARSAMVEAVRSGADGFADVADEMRRLADRSRQTAGGIGRSLTDLTARLDDVLSDDRDYDRDVEAAETTVDTPMTRRLAGVADAHRAMSRTLSTVLREALAAAGQVEDSSDTLRGETTGAVGHVQFQDISRQMLEHVTAALGDLRRQSGDLVAYSQGALPAEALRERMIQVDDLRDRHIMAGQRATHAASTGGRTEADSAPMIELF
jgi:methyl-accepting chemotaxis protein